MVSIRKQQNARARNRVPGMEVPKQFEPGTNLNTHENYHSLTCCPMIPTSTSSGLPFAITFLCFCEHKRKAEQLGITTCSKQFSNQRSPSLRGIKTHRQTGGEKEKEERERKRKNKKDQ